MDKSLLVSRIAWATAIGLTVSQALIEFWKKLYVGPDKALIHAVAILTVVGIAQVGIIMAPKVIHRHWKWRIAIAGLMVPVLASLGYLTYWQSTRLAYLIEHLPIPPLVWYSQLALLPLGVLGYAAVLIALLWSNKPDAANPAMASQFQTRRHCCPVADLER